MKKKAIDIVKESREEIVQKVIENIKKGYIISPEAWNKNVFVPYNPISEARYRGGNRFRLMLAANVMEYNDPRWMTYNQVKKTDGLSFQSYDRTKGILCEKWIFEKEQEVIDPVTNIKRKEMVSLDVPICNYFVLYNAEEIKGLPPLEMKELTRDETLDVCEKFMNSSECVIKEKNQNKACYSPNRDEILIPNRNLFRDTEAFFSTVLHEMGHSTGHPSRLNRKLTGCFGSPEYAKEELRAELSSLFTEADLGIDLGQHGFNAHTEYLESWIGALQNDVNELFSAIRDADASTKYLMNNYEKLMEREKIEQTHSLNEKKELSRIKKEKEDMVFER